MLSKILKEYSDDELLPSKQFEKHVLSTGVVPSRDEEELYNPLYQDIENYDIRHNRSVGTPLYLNDFDFNIKEEREAVVDLLRTEFPDNNFDTVASCSCRKYRSNALAGRGFVCEKCHSEIIKPLVNKIETKLWLKLPAGVSGFINPAIYVLLFSKLNTKSPKINIVDYWIDASYRKEKRRQSGNIAKNVERIIQFSEYIGVPFGYNNFVENVDKIVRALIEHDALRVLDAKEKERLEFAEFWNIHRESAISHFVPLPNKVTTVVESDQRDRYISEEQTKLNKIFFTIADCHKEGDPKVKDNEVLVGKYTKELVNGLQAVQKDILYGKKGIFRYHAGAGKVPLTGRSIITSESYISRADTVVLPRLYGLTCLDKHLTSYLYRKGFTPVQVKRMIREAAHGPQKEVDEFLDWVENNKYAIALTGRQPTIQYLSNRALFVKFNRDINDKSIRIPILGVGPWNADFDGDEMYVIFVPDLVGKVDAYAHWGHQQALDPNKLFKISRFYGQTKTNLLNLNSLLLETPIEDE